MEFFIYLFAGVCAGLLSGLFGVGGGLIIVPILSVVFTGLAFAGQHIMHLALGTSLATIIFTSIASTRTHHNCANVDWHVVRIITPGIVLGTLLGSAVASSLQTAWLEVIFAAFVFFAATQILFNFSPDPSREMPGTLGTGLAGMGIGALSSLVGIGGGTLSVPFLVYCNTAIKKAIGTSAAIGLPIALSGAIGFMANGWYEAALPEFSMGYVYLPALLGIVLASTLTAPFGARLAHWLPAMVLKRTFAALLYLIGLKMLWSLW
jgi:uncharacterized membrane protein YfcA